MTPAFRKTSRPSDGHFPADWHDRRAQFRSDLWLLLLVPAIGVALTAAAIIFGVTSS